jgi:hypothetical protein
MLAIAKHEQDLLVPEDRGQHVAGEDFDAERGSGRGRDRRGSASGARSTSRTPSS